MTEESQQGHIFPVDYDKKASWNVIFPSWCHLASCICCLSILLLLFLLLGRYKQKDIPFLLKYCPVCSAFCEFIISLISFSIGNNVIMSNGKYFVEQYCDIQEYVESIAYVIHKISLYLFFLNVVKYLFNISNINYNIAFGMIILVMTFILGATLMILQPMIYVANDNKMIEVCGVYIDDNLKNDYGIFLISDISIHIYFIYQFVKMGNKLESSMIKIIGIVLLTILCEWCANILFILQIIDLFPVQGSVHTVCLFAALNYCLQIQKKKQA
eukprot:190247_1